MIHLMNQIVVWLQLSEHAVDGPIRLLRCPHHYQKLRSHLDHQTPVKTPKYTKLHLPDSNSTSSSTSGASGCPPSRRMPWCTLAYPRPLLCNIEIWSTLAAPNSLPIRRRTYTSNNREPVHAVVIQQLYPFQTRMLLMHGCDFSRRKWDWNHGECTFLFPFRTERWPRPNIFDPPLIQKTRSPFRVVRSKYHLSTLFFRNLKDLGRPFFYSAANCWGYGPRNGKCPGVIPIRGNASPLGQFTREPRISPSVARSRESR